jgi:hypothetical protein
MGWASFCAILSQTNLVTLTACRPDLLLRLLKVERTGFLFSKHDKLWQPIFSH